jgi:hypothetical protein
MGYIPQSRISKPEGSVYIPLMPLVAASFSSAFLVRALTLIKFPSVINLAHLGIIPLVFVLVLHKARVKDRTQIKITYHLLIAILIFLWVTFCSALLNDAGIINAIMNFLFFGEHFLFLITLVCLPLTAEKFYTIRAFLVGCAATNTLFAYAQHYVFQLHHKPGLEDNIKGVFVGGGAGHVVGASVALTFGIVYCVDAKKMPVWFRALVMALTFWHMNMADAKQVLLSLGMAGGCLLLTKFNNVVEAIKFIVGGALLGSGFWWCMQNLEAFRAFNTWMRPEIYGPNGEATLLKTAAIRIVSGYHEHWWHPWLGIGPGHSVGRLGGWMLGAYDSLLSPLGSTIHPASQEVWVATGQSWLGDQSSMFSPFFGWAGIWGDVGWLGLFSFLYIWWVVWKYLCFDDLSRFLLFCPLMFGLIFTQMEEPGYMVYVATLIGLRWQQHHLTQRGILPPPTATSNENRSHPKRKKTWRDRIRTILLGD